MTDRPMTELTDADDFDARLRARLARLESAAPVGAIPSMATGEGASVATRRGGRSRRRFVALLAAAALLTLAGGVLGQGMLWPDEAEVPHPALEAALGEAFGGCVPMAEAEALARQAMDATGYGDWTIESRQGATGLPCTSASIAGEMHAVLLFPASGQELVDLYQALADEMLARCLDGDEAKELWTSALTVAGVTDFEIRIDPWGPQGGPVDQLDAYKAHVAAGCTVYVGLGWDEQGTTQFYLWRNWP